MFVKMIYTKLCKQFRGGGGSTRDPRKGGGGYSENTLVEVCRGTSKSGIWHEHNLKKGDLRQILGLVVDDKLTWKCHIDYIGSKVSKLIGILIIARNILPICSLITLYNSLLNPYFTYCINIWENTFKTHLKRIEILQKKIIRIITFPKHDAHTKLLHVFQKLRIMTFKDMYTYFSSMYIYKCINNLLPPPIIMATNSFK